MNPELEQVVADTQRRRLPIEDRLDGIDRKLDEILRLCQPTPKRIAELRKPDRRRSLEVMALFNAWCHSRAGAWETTIEMYTKQIADEIGVHCIPLGKAITKIKADYPLCVLRDGKGTKVKISLRPKVLTVDNGPQPVEPSR